MKLRTSKGAVRAMKIKSLFLSAVLVTGAAVSASAQTSWLHVSVDGNETVRISVPLILAEKMIPAIQMQTNKVHRGKTKVSFGDTNIEPHEFLAALRDSPDGIFVTVEKNDQSVRVAKENGYLIIKAKPGKRDRNQSNVDMRLPLDVLDALIGKGEDFDLRAAIRVLASHRDLPMISVSDDHQTVRIWIDGKMS